MLRLFCRGGDMIAVDTDMIGPYGYCADLSRSWICGHRRMNDLQKRLYGSALAQIHHNLALVAPGVAFREFNEKSWQIPERHQPYRYTLAAHGVGLADEWPIVPLHTDFETACEGQFEPGWSSASRAWWARPAAKASSWRPRFS
jgi:Xaa-Pro aminopeptidase